MQKCEAFPFRMKFHSILAILMWNWFYLLQNMFPSLLNKISSSNIPAGIKRRKLSSLLLPEHEEERNTKGRIWESSKELLQYTGNYDESVNKHVSMLHHKLLSR